MFFYLFIFYFIYISLQPWHYGVDCSYLWELIGGDVDYNPLEVLGHFLEARLFGSFLALL